MTIRILLQPNPIVSYPFIAVTYSIFLHNQICVKDLPQDYFTAKTCEDTVRPLFSLFS